MMKETLTCEYCGKQWKREIVRGRKPRECPKCTVQSVEASKVNKKPASSNTAVKRNRRAVNATKLEDTPLETSSTEIAGTDISLNQVWSMLVPKPVNWRELSQKTANGSIWRCPKCKNTLEFTLALADVPTHKCTPASRPQRLELIS